MLHNHIVPLWIIGNLGNHSNQNSIPKKKIKECVITTWLTILLQSFMEGLVVFQLEGKVNLQYPSGETAVENLKNKPC